MMNNQLTFPHVAFFCLMRWVNVVKMFIVEKVQDDVFLLRILELTVKCAIFKYAIRAFRQVTNYTRRFNNDF